MFSILAKHILVLGFRCTSNQHRKSIMLFV